MTPDNTIALAGGFADAAALAHGLTSSTGVMIGFFDASHRIAWCNDRFAEWFGVPPSSLVGRALSDVYGAEAFAEALPRLQRALGGEHVRYERLLEKPGSPAKWISVSLHPHRGPDGAVLGLFACSIEVDELRRTRDALDHSLQEIAIYLENSPLAVVEWDRDGRVRRWAGEAERVFGRRADDVLGRTAQALGLVDQASIETMDAAMRELLEGRALRQRVLCRNRRASGEAIDCEWFLSAFVDRSGTTRGVLSLAQDVTARVEAEAQLRHAAIHDGLTGAHNRRHLMQRLEDAIARAVEHGGAPTLLYLDLDRFKPVNDRHGHAVGDALLKAVVGRLRHCAREADCIARVGGDEFVLLMDGLADPAQVARIHGRVVEHLAEPFRIGDHTLRIGASVGIARFPDDGDSADALLRHADARMYRQKVPR